MGRGGRPGASACGAIESSSALLSLLGADRTPSAGIDSLNCPALITPAHLSLDVGTSLALYH